MIAASMPRCLVDWWNVLLSLHPPQVMRCIPQTANTFNGGWRGGDGFTVYYAKELVEHSQVARMPPSPPLRRLRMRSAEVKHLTSPASCAASRAFQPSWPSHGQLVMSVCSQTCTF